MKIVVYDSLKNKIVEPCRKFDYYINSDGILEVSHGWNSEKEPTDYYPDNRYTLLQVQYDNN